MRFKHKRVFPIRNETRFRKKFAWKPVTIRQEKITVWLCFYYIKEIYIPSYHSYENNVKKYCRGEPYNNVYLKGKWSKLKIATKEQMFIDEL